MLRVLIAVMMALTLSVGTPQAWGAVKAGKNAELASKGPRKHLSTIVFAGVAGAILGLSTLSFYGRPQDKLNNIAMGAAVGIIIGATYSTYRAATEPRDFYARSDRNQAFWLMSENPRQLPRPPPSLNLEFSY